MSCSAWLELTRLPVGSGKTIDRMQKSVDVLQSIMSTPDKGIPEEVLSGAKCIVVVPNLIKGGFIRGRQARTRRGYVPHC